MQYVFPPDFVFWTNIDDHQEVKEFLLPQIRERESESAKNPTDWYCEVNSSYALNDIDESFNRFLFEDYVASKIIWEPLDKMLKEVKNIPIPTSSTITEGWFNTYTVGQYQEIHNHLTDQYEVNGKSFRDTFSLIYIIDSEDDQNKTMFYSLGHHSCTKGHNNMTFDTSEVSSIKEGTVIIFPCHLLHYVQPAKKSRTTISYNIASEFS